MPVVAFGCCRLCPVTAEHWHWDERRPYPLPRVITPGQTGGVPQAACRDHHQPDEETPDGSE